MSEVSSKEGNNTWLEAAHTFDAWRPFPRIFIGTYIYILFLCFEWFTGLDDPSSTQAAFASTIIGAGAAWFGLYVNSGKKD